MTMIAARRWIVALALAVLPFVVPASSQGAEAAALVSRIRAVAGEGTGNADAAIAWRELTALGPAGLPETLAAFRGASPLAANWLRNAVDAILEAETRAGRTLPREMLERFVREAGNDPAARRLAYEWLCRADPSTPARLLPQMTNDPSVEIRRDAVAVMLKKAQATLDRGDKEASKTAYQEALTCARDKDQVDLIAGRLKGLGVPVDLAAHFGYLRTWHVIGPFDNRAGKGHAAVFEPEKKVDLDRSCTGRDGKAIRWAAATSDHPTGMVNFNKLIAEQKEVTAYATVEIESPSEQPVEIRAASKNAIKVFLNGRQVYAKEEYHHGLYMDQHAVRVTLQKGKNRLLVKVSQNEMVESWTKEWEFQLRLCDAVGTGLSLAVVSPAAASAPTPAREEVK